MSRLLVLSFLVEAMARSAEAVKSQEVELLRRLEREQQFSAQKSSHIEERLMRSQAG